VTIILCFSSRLHVVDDLFGDNVSEQLLCFKRLLLPTGSFGDQIIWILL